MKQRRIPITWREWQDKLDSDPTIRERMAEIQSLRRMGRINRQLAAAVRAETGTYWHYYDGHWVAADTPVCRRAKMLKRLFRADFARRIKNLRDSIPYETPKPPSGAAYRGSLRIERAIDFAKVKEEAEYRLGRLWPDRHSPDSRRTIRYDLSRLKIVGRVRDPFNLPSPRNRLPLGWRYLGNGEYYQIEYPGCRSRWHGPIDESGRAPVRYYASRYRLIGECVEQVAAARRKAIAA